MSIEAILSEWRTARKQPCAITAISKFRMQKIKEDAERT